MLSTQAARQVLNNGSPTTILLFPLGISPVQRTFNDTTVFNGTYTAPFNATYYFSSDITFTVVNLAPGSAVTLTVQLIINAPSFPPTQDQAFEIASNPLDDTTGNFVKTVSISKLVKLATGNRVNVGAVYSLTGRSGGTLCVQEVSIQIGNFKGWLAYH